MIHLNLGACVRWSFKGGRRSSDISRQWVEPDQLLLLGENDGKSE